MVVVGTVIGAGFASGREVQYFFGRFGSNGLMGALLASLLMAAFGLRVVILCRRYRAHEYTALVSSRLNRESGYVLSGCLCISMWLALGVMLSGAGAAGQSLGVSRLVSIVFTGALVAGGIAYGIKGLKLLNLWLIPLLLVIILYLSIQAPLRTSGAFLILQPEETSWVLLVWSATLYAAFNSMLLVVVIPPLLLQDGKSTGLVWGLIIVGVLLILVASLLLHFSQTVRSSPLPLLEVVAILTPRFPQVYALILWIALCTTALSNAYGVSDRLHAVTRLSRQATGVLVTLSAFPLGLQPFGRLVSLIYPGLGYMALVVVGLLLLPPSFMLKLRYIEVIEKKYRT